MGKKLKQLKEDNSPHLKDPQIRAFMDDADQMHSIKALGDTQGGKALVDLLTRDIIALVHKLASPDGDSIPLRAELKSTLNLMKLILNAEENESLLDEAIEEALHNL